MDRELRTVSSRCHFLALITLPSLEDHDSAISFLSWYLADPSPQPVSARVPQELVPPFLLFSIHTFSL
jgi:hypothetical protein